MASTKRLKVFRTVAGFHDAYVAAPSQKAALAAWGSDKNLFARGLAELVTDEALGAEALAAPGTVIRRSRGTSAEQIAALPPDKPRRRAPENEVTHGSEPGARSKRTKRHPGKPTHKPPSIAPPPRPSSDPLDAARSALKDIEADHRQALQQLQREEAALARRRLDLERVQRHERSAAIEHRDEEQRAYDIAMTQWRAAKERGSSDG